MRAMHAKRDRLPAARGALTGLVLGACLLAAGTSACLGGRAAPAARTPAAPSPVATSMARPAARLSDAQLDTLLRRAVCWLDEPARARACLPPSPDALAAIEEMGRSGDRRLAAPLVDLLNLELGWAAAVDAALARLTGERPTEARGWREWLTAQPRIEVPPGYARWKARLLALTSTPETKTGYEALLARADGGVAPLDAATLAALHWTGVQPDASRPLREPAAVPPRAQRYLGAPDVVYGVVVGSESRAYPQRIIAWHGVVNDTLNGRPIIVVHCLPCGGAAAFERGEAGGKPREFGTTGLALGARTLLSDTAESRLWDAVSGTAVGAGATAGTPRPALKALPVFTTTWGDWQARHGETSVLDIATGVVRDYAPGAATRDETASTRPLYPVRSDGRLPEREPVLGVVTGSAALTFPLSEVQSRHLVTSTLAGGTVVALSEGPGLAAGVYAPGTVRLVRAEGSGSGFSAIDEAGGRWAMREHALVEVGSGRELPALRWWQGYWFAWAGAYPETAVAGA